MPPRGNIDRVDLGDVPVVPGPCEAAVPLAHLVSHHRSPAHPSQRARQHAPARSAQPVDFSAQTVDGSEIEHGEEAHCQWRRACPESSAPAVPRRDAVGGRAGLSRSEVRRPPVGAAERTPALRDGDRGSNGLRGSRDNGLARDRAGLAGPWQMRGATEHQPLGACSDPGPEHWRSCPASEGLGAAGAGVSSPEGRFVCARSHHDGGGYAHDTTWGSCCVRRAEGSARAGVMAGNGARGQGRGQGQGWAGALVRRRCRPGSGLHAGWCRAGGSLWPAMEPGS